MWPFSSRGCTQHHYPDREEGTELGPIKVQGFPMSGETHIRKKMEANCMHEGCMTSKTYWYTISKVELPPETVMAKIEEAVEELVEEATE